MRLPSFLLHEITVRAVLLKRSREPDFVIGDKDRPYMQRWHWRPRNRWFNIYLHKFCKSDDDRALHDHPWPSCSIIIYGRYVEHTIAAGGIHHRRTFRRGDVIFRRAKSAHRIELPGDTPCETVFITGPRVREWGFHCPGGWVPWQQFVAPDDHGSIGRGCGEHHVRD